MNEEDQDRDNPDAVPIEVLRNLMAQEIALACDRYTEHSASIARSRGVSGDIDPVIQTAWLCGAMCACSTLSRFDGSKNLTPHTIASAIKKISDMAGFEFTKPSYRDEGQHD